MLTCVSGHLFNQQGIKDEVQGGTAGALWCQGASGTTLVGLRCPSVTLSAIEGRGNVMRDQTRVGDLPGPNLHIIVQDLTVHCFV